MKKQPFIAVSIVAFVLGSVAATAAYAGPESRDDRKQRLHSGAGMHDGADPARMVRHLSEKLELDQTQRQEIENIVAAAKPGMDALRERARANRNAMHALDVNDANHDAKLSNLASEKGAIATEQALMHGRLESDINAVLTAEQRQELAARSGKMRERWQTRKDGRSRN